MRHDFIFMYASHCFLSFVFLLIPAHWHATNHMAASPNQISKWFNMLKGWKGLDINVMNGFVTVNRDRNNSTRSGRRVSVSVGGQKMV